MDMLLLGSAIAVMLLSLARLAPLVRRNKLMFGRYFPPGARRADPAAELPQWPIPHWWPNGKCACPGCQIDAGVKHICGGTEVWQTCDCRPAKTGTGRS